MANFLQAGLANNSIQLVDVDHEGSDVYVLNLRNIDSTNYRVDPDGTKSFFAELYLTKLSATGVVQSDQKIDSLYAAGENTNVASLRGTFNVNSSGKINIFVTEKSDGLNFSQNGFTYSKDSNFNKNFLFKESNYGWYPYYDGSGFLNHFSFAGYYAMQETTSLGYMKPEAFINKADDIRLTNSGLTGGVNSWNDLNARLINDVLSLSAGKIWINATDAITQEGDDGIKYAIFTASRDGDLSVSATVDWTVSGSGTAPASASDFKNSVLPSGTVIFAKGTNTANIQVPINGDLILEFDETYTVTLSNPSDNLQLGVGTILNSLKEKATGKSELRETYYTLDGGGGDFLLEYNMQRIPDKIDIFINGVLTASTMELVSGVGELTIPSDRLHAGDQMLVRVTGNNDVDTVWEYLISYTKGVQNINYIASGTILDDGDNLSIEPGVKGKLAQDIFLEQGFYQTFFKLSAASYHHLGKNYNLFDPADRLKYKSYSDVNSNDFGIDFFRSTQNTNKYKDLNLIEKTYALPKNLGKHYNVAFQDGCYVGYTDGMLDVSSVAFVGRSEDAIFITFRGTDSTGDQVDDLFGMERHFARYKPLFDSIDSYLLSENSNIKHVYVSGHSLGGQMAMMYMEEHPKDRRFEAVTFEAANKFVKFTSESTDERFVNFEMRGDPVPDLGLGANYGKTIYLEYENSPEYFDINKMSTWDPLGSHYMYKIDNAFDKVLSIIEPEKNKIKPLDKDNRIYVDDDLDGVIITPTYPFSTLLKEAEVVTASGLALVIPASVAGLFVTATGLALAGLGAAIAYEDTLEYWATGYDIDTAFEGEDGILVLNPFVGFSGGVYDISKGVQTVIVGDDKITPSENISINASSASDRVFLFGNSANNILVGGSGNDFIFGGADQDILIGGDGNDVLFGGLYRNIGLGLPTNRATEISNLVKKYSDHPSVDPVDVGYYIGGFGADLMIGELSDSNYAYNNRFDDNDGDNDYFFIDVDRLVPYGDQRNVDSIQNFYVAGSDASANDWLVFSAEQLGLSVQTDLEPFFDEITLPFGLMGYVMNLEKIINYSYEERFFKVKDFDEYYNNNPFGSNEYLNDEDYFVFSENDEADSLFAFVLETSTGSLYFDWDGNMDYNDAIKVATINSHPKSDKISDMHANQIIIIPNFDFVEIAKITSLDTGKLIDGYISGASIFLDANNNGMAESYENTGVKTDAYGNFSLLSASPLPVIAVGGINIDTGLPNTMTLSAPVGATVVSPLTTLVRHVAYQQNIDASAAQTVVQQVLNLPTWLELSHYDPLAQDPTDITALTIQQRAAQVSTLITLAPQGDTSFSSVAAAIGASDGHTLDLSNATVLKKILPSESMAVIEKVAQINQRIDATNSINEISAVQQTVISNSSFMGTMANDIFASTIGNETFNGISGVDAVSYSQNLVSYTIATTKTGYIVSGPEGVDVLINIERIQFADKTLALDIDGNAGQAYRVYQAAFNRTPDNDGLKYWIDAMDGGSTLESVANNFIHSTEFIAMYGANPSTAQFVTKLYDNVLHRQYEQGGYDFWTGALNRNEATKAQVLASFSESPENQAGVIGVIQNGIELLA